jgi:hypothetical protein
MGKPATGSDALKRGTAVAAAIAVSCWCALTPPLAVAQDSAPPPVAIQPTPPPPPPEHKTGLFEAIGRWVDRGATNFSDHLRGAKRSMEDLNNKAAVNNREMTDQAAKVGQGAVSIGKNTVDATVDATKNAVDAVAKLPTARLVSGHERCVVAPNGAPDCLAAAELLCRKKGFSTGKSMDFTSAEECPAKAMVGEVSKDECTTVTFISRAMCQ